MLTVPNEVSWEQLFAAWISNLLKVFDRSLLSSALPPSLPADVTATSNVLRSRGAERSDGHSEEC